MKGYVQVYTGDGKGKTTAALGLAIRAAGTGYRVFIGQFIKGMFYSELNSLERFSDQITLRQYGRDCFISREPSREDINLARNGLAEMSQILARGDHQLVILDEANIALYYRLFSFDELWQAIANRHPSVEVVITGRRAPPELIEKADLVTEMKEIKHYYSSGIEARDGIEK